LSQYADSAGHTHWTYTSNTVEWIGDCRTDFQLAGNGTAVFRFDHRAGLPDDHGVDPDVFLTDAGCTAAGRPDVRHCRSSRPTGSLTGPAIFCDVSGHT